MAFAVIITLSRHAIGSSATTTTSTIASTTTTTSVVTTTTNASSTTTTCRGIGFTGTYNEGEGAAGTIYASATLTKTSAGTCTMQGWPLLTLQDKDGAVLALTQVNVPSSAASFSFGVTAADHAPSMLTLHQGSTMTFSLAYSDVTTGNTACDTATTMNVRLSSSDTSIIVTPPYPIEPCNNGEVWVSPFY